MRKLSIITLFVLSVVVWSCTDVERNQSRVYMPDMAYSRAYETFASHDTLKAQGINYTAMPVAGTVKRGELYPFPIKKDLEGDSTNYIASRQVANPIASLNPEQTTEAERLYLVNCAICHGSKLDGQGPLYADGTGPYSAAPKNLIADPIVSVMPEGQLFYSVTYGKNVMGPYASQLSTTQRWMVVKYVKMKQLEKQGGAKVTTAPKDSTGAATATTDSVAAKK